VNPDHVETLSSRNSAGRAEHAPVVKSAANKDGHRGRRMCSEGA